MSQFTCLSFPCVSVCNFFPELARLALLRLLCLAGLRRVGLGSPELIWAALGGAGLGLAWLGLAGLAWCAAAAIAAAAAAASADAATAAAPAAPAAAAAAIEHFVFFFNKFFLFSIR